MKKFAALLILLTLINIGSSATHILNRGSVEGFWFGDEHTHKVQGCLVSDKDNGVGYLGFYTNKESAVTCNLAVSVNHKGECTLQVIDPSDNSIYHLDLVKLAKEKGEKYANSNF